MAIARLGRPLATPPPGSLAERIRQRRLALGIASQQFADAVGVNLRTVGAWERGEVEPRSRSVRSAIARVLGEGVV